MKNPERQFEPEEKIIKEEVGGQNEASAEEFQIPKIYKPYQEKETKKELKYQTIEDITFQEIKEGDPDFNTARILLVEPNQSEEEIKKKLTEQISQENWWLQKYWQEKGLPIEQIKVNIGNRKLNIYNFYEKLTDRHLKDLERVLREFSCIEDGRIFDEIKFILIDNKRKIITERHLEKNLGEEKHGESRPKCKTIEIYPRGMEFTSFRINGVSKFEATLIHELSHSIPDIKPFFYNEWIKKFRWEIRGVIEDGTERYGKWECEHPEKCVTEYAKYAPEEDISESMVAALRNPKILDPERLQFLKDNLLIKIKEQKLSEIEAKRLTNSELELPAIESPIKFKINLNKIKIYE